LIIISVVYLYLFQTIYNTFSSLLFLAVIGNNVKFYVIVGLTGLFNGNVLEFP